MKIASLTISTALAVVALVSPPTVSAFGECSAAQLEAIEAVDFTDLEVACPSIYSNANGIDVTDIDTITAESLKVISPCKASACKYELGYTALTTPDCLDKGFNFNGVFSAYLELCEKFGSGDVTVSEAKEIFTAAGIIRESVNDDITDIIGNNGGETGGEANNTTAVEEPETEEPETEVPATEVPETEVPATEAPATQETPVVTKPDTSVATTSAPPTPAPTPAPTSAPTSGASATAIVGVTVVASVALVASLLL